MKFKEKCTSLKNRTLLITKQTHPAYSISWDANCCSAYQDIPQNFMELAVHYSVFFNVLLMHDYSKSILIEIIKIHFNIILAYPQRPSEWTLSFPIFHTKICSRLYPFHACYITYPFCHSSSSSFYWASVANVPNVLQPYWLIVLPFHVKDLTASLLLWGPNGQRCRCLWTFLFSNVPTYLYMYLCMY